MAEGLAGRRRDFAAAGAAWVTVRELRAEGRRAAAVDDGAGGLFAEGDRPAAQVHCWREDNVGAPAGVRR